ncbi:hypothetical protein BST81_02065 [Leptolyngbya sp. 'hensonii']|nr:hypothetical protein BST81_02065 [Leptolyngbya sp. 'hensonii']
MEGLRCGHPNTHKHGKPPNGGQRYFCLQCQQTFNERFDTTRPIAFAQRCRKALGSSLRGISHTSGLAYNTVLSLVCAASQQAQWVHNAEIQAVQTEAVSANELWSFVARNKSNTSQKN